MNKSDVIDTTSGQMQGYKEDDLVIFKGIPYAEPPIDELRFSPPVPKKRWDGVLEATKYGACSYQGYTLLEDFTGKLQPEGEDCLNLNIWTPNIDNKKRPVMFWIHGGAFIMGSGVDTMYDGSALVRRGDVVVVTINYRLGVLGYSYIPGVTVNAGHLDQILALKWVHDNIERFGGDPNNVTIFGESAGGYSVVALAAMPAAKGLFHRIIAQSAPAIDPKVTKKPTKKVMRMLGVDTGDINALRKVSPEKIITAQNEFMEEDTLNLLAFRPLIDGETLPIHPLEAFQNGDCKNIDFMIGTNLDEAKLFTALSPDLANLDKIEGDKLLMGFLGRLGIDNNKSNTMIDIYKQAREGNYSTDAKEIMNALLTDNLFRISTIRLLEAQSKYQPNTYNYLFTWPSPAFKGNLGACHALELPFVFNTLTNPAFKDFIGKSPDLDGISHKMMDAWIAFARSGNPNHDGIPNWPSYDIEKRSTMLINKEFKVAEKFLDKERAAWNDIFR
ncbi:MAG: carboxylesterase/lipase family protein [Candidatus Lokiarchaeota archaeon]|nr:carboxylesterase/lipase family protein [Candidatus Lokiarchaeota archaeon]